MATPILHRRSSGLVTHPESISRWWCQEWNTENPKTLNSTSLNFIAHLYHLYRKKKGLKHTESSWLRHRLIRARKECPQKRPGQISTEKSDSESPHQTRTFSKSRIFRNVGPKLFYCLSSMCPAQRFELQGKTSRSSFVYQIIKGNQETTDLQFCFRVKCTGSGIRQLNCCDALGRLLISLSFSFLLHKVEVARIMI